MYNFAILGIYTNSKTCMSIFDDFGNLVQITVPQINNIYSVFCNEETQKFWHE